MTQETSGRITAEMFERHASDWKREQERLERTIAEHRAATAVVFPKEFSYSKSFQASEMLFKSRQG